MVGYSKTPLAKKLGYKAGFQTLHINPPSHYLDLLVELPEDVHIDSKPQPKQYDLIHLFARERADLPKDYMKSLLVANGMIWISWPKKSSPLAGELNENIIRSLGLEAD